MRALYILTSLSIGLLFAYTAQAAPVNVTCTPPTTREDGTPLAAAEIQGYEFVTTHGTGETTTYTVSGCTFSLTIAKPGNYTAVMHTIDTAQRRSAASNSVPFVVESDSPPMCPGAINITVTPSVPAGPGR